MLVGALRLELNGEPIRVTEIAPGMVHTEEFTLNRLGGDRDLLLIQAAYQRQDGDTPGAELTLAGLAAINPHDPALGQRPQETKP